MYPHSQLASSFQRTPSFPHSELSLTEGRKERKTSFLFYTVLGLTILYFDCIPSLPTFLVFVICNTCISYRRCLVLLARAILRIRGRITPRPRRFGSLTSLLLSPVRRPRRRNKSGFGSVVCKLLASYSTFSQSFFLSGIVMQGRRRWRRLAPTSTSTSSRQLRRRQ